MKEIIMGTTNQAKIDQLCGVLILDGITVVGLPDKVTFPEINESGTTAVENAKIKALTYSKVLGKPVLSMDNALYIDGLEPSKQPGVNVRRIHKDILRPTDEMLLEYYSQLIASLGESVNGHWEFGICIAFPDGKFDETTIISKRNFVAKPSLKIQPGYPLESIQKDPQTGKYISEMTREEQDQFWQQMIGQPLREFVTSVGI